MTELEGQEKEVLELAKEYVRLLTADPTSAVMRSTYGQERELATDFRLTRLVEACLRLENWEPFPKELPDE